MVIIGDRGNLVVKGYDDRQVYLYSHWGGTNLPGTLSRALVAGESRWNDEAYLARVIFAHMIEGRPVDDTTGYGISARLGDNEHAILVVNAVQQTVEVWAADWSGDPSEDTWQQSYPIQTWIDMYGPETSWGYLLPEDEFERLIDPTKTEVTA